jgi:hypothetical protein
MRGGGRERRLPEGGWRCLAGMAGTRSPSGSVPLRALSCCAFHHAHGAVKRWHAARLAGTVGVALAAPVVIAFAPSLEQPLDALAGAWVLAARLVLRPAEQRAVRLAVAVQEMHDQHVLGLVPTAALRLPAYEQVCQMARWCAGSPDPDWYSVPAHVNAGTPVLIAQRSGAVWSRRLFQEWAIVLAVLAAG